MVEFHIHTQYCPCVMDKQLTVTNIIRKCEAESFSAIALTPHFHLDTEPEIFTKIRQEIDAARPRLKVYLGCEADVLDDNGRLSIQPELAKQLDFVIVGPNHYNISYLRKFKADLKEMIDYEQRILLASARNPLVKAIAHPWIHLTNLVQGGSLPDYPLLTSLDLVPLRYFKEFARVCFENNIAVEISGGVLERKMTTWPGGKKYLQSVYVFYEILRDEGVSFMMSSDAHRLKDVGSGLVSYVIANDLGINAKQIWTFEKMVNGRR